MNERRGVHGGRWPLHFGAQDTPSRALARLRADSLFRNSCWLMLTTIVTSLLGAVFWAVAAHLYAPRQVGGRTRDSSWPITSSTLTPENSASASSSSRWLSTGMASSLTSSGMT